MIALENYKDNIDFTDKFGVKNVKVSKSIVFNNHCDTEKKKNCEDKHHTHVPPMAATVLGLDNTCAPCDPCIPAKPQQCNFRTDIDAQQLFLEVKPTCYLILCKPGAGAYSLGEAISKKYNCIHLCPKNVIVDEIEQSTPTGHCIDFNMKHNSVCKIDTILPIMKTKLESPSVKHRGYVISGLPLVTSNRSSLCLFNTLYAEESLIAMNELLYDVIINLKKKKPIKPKPEPGSPRTSVSSVPEQAGENAEEEQHEEEQEAVLEEEEEDLVVELPQFVLDTCADIVYSKKAYYQTKKAVLLQQLDELFKLEMRPDIIIYITCPDTDIVAKKTHKCLNYKTGLNTTEPFITNILSDLRWPTKYSMSDYTSPRDNHMINSKYNCRQPINFPERSIEQMCSYKNHILPILDDKLKDFTPKHIIKLDGRTSIHQMMHHITQRLHVLPIVKPVLIPEPLYLEEPPGDTEEFWKFVEESNVIRSGVIGFNRYASPWVNRCPVELKKRQAIRGKFKLAVSYFKHVYLLSSLDAMITFCRNPRPFLKLYYLEPTCRIIVIGTKSSGKTLISECLSWIFDCPVIYFNTIYEKEKKIKYDNFCTSILSEIIGPIEDARYKKWQNAETLRLSKIEEWQNTILTTLKKYIPLLMEYKAKQKDQNDIFFETFNSTRNQLKFLPFLDDHEECKNAIKIKMISPEYAPESLTTVTEAPKIPTVDDADVKEAISAYIKANELQKEVEPTPEQLMNEIIKMLSDIDKESQELTNAEVLYGKYVIDGFPSDPEYWELLKDAKLLPDNTIALIENREMNPELALHYKYLETCLKNYQERFMLANDPLIKTKLLTKKPSDSKIIDMQIIVHESIDMALNSIGIEETENTGNEETDWITTFNQSVDKFRENWDSLKLKLEENYKSYIEVELETKSDVQLIEDVLLKLRRSYCMPCTPNEDVESEVQEDEDETPKDFLTFNHPNFLCETNIYCPIAYFDHGILWEGKPELFIKYDNKVHNFCNEESMELFRNDVTKYQSYNKPYKKLPPLRICVIGCVGSGKTTVSKHIAKELGLLHIDFAEIINDYLMPRHFKKVGRQHENSFIDIPIDEEGVVEFQMGEENENMVSDILSNETELRRMVFNYFERGAPLLSVLMQKFVKKFWFEDPFLTTGFVMDGYPRLPTDVEDMIASFCIPDLIIELESSLEVTLERLAPKMFRMWKMQLNEAKLLAKDKFDKEKKEWFDMITEKVVVKVVYDDILECVFTAVNELVKVVSTESAMIDADPSASIDTKLFSTYNAIIQEYPEPVDLSEWEKPNEVQERIDTRLEGIYESDDENIQTSKDLLAEQRIRVVSVDASKPLNKLFKLVLSKLSNLRNRCESFFEQTFIVSWDIAELLLSQGFFFMSKFNRMCPVYIFENPVAILNPYQTSRRLDKIFPVAYRAYIYFINGEDNLKKFRTNPLIYVDSDKILSFHEYPVRIGVIGPPKSGKSALAAKLAKQYGLMCVSRGMAVRSILENMNWTELASKMMNFLQKGECIDSDLIIKAVQMVTIDHRTVTHGFVLDGFPTSASETKELTKNGLYPLIMFDLSTDKNILVKNSQNEIHYDIIKIKPPYPRSFIEHRYMMWNVKHTGVRNYINNDCQNIFMLNGNESRWQCLQDANNYIATVVPKIHYYLNNVKSKIVPVDVMCITNEIFQQRISCFRNMCPVCLSKNILRHSEFPVDRKGLVQYKNRFYWICADHMPLVINNPDKYLVSTPEIDIPEVPAVVKTIINISLVYENGVCIVTYAENLPTQKIVRGNNNFAANFQGKTYLFCDAKCLAKFLAKPKMYSDVVVFQNTKNFPKLSLNKLPNIGYLEQTVGNILTEACCSVNVLRPKYPGLGIELSALLYIALYLKIHNPLTDNSFLPMYQKAYKIYKARSKLILDVGLQLRSMDNPFANYPKCCRDRKIPDSDTVCKPATSRVPVPDERFDYLVEFHKPVSKVPAFLNVVDIAGLVRGAAEGQGLGNAFLSHIKACDAIFNLCRAFDDEDVIHVDGDVNPVRDLETIGEELRLKDIEQLLQHVDKLDRVVNRGNDKKLKPEYDSLMKVKAILVDEKKHIRFGDWSAADIEVLNKYLFLTSKPALYLVNLSEKDYIRKKNKWLPKLKEWIDKNDPGAPLIPFSGALETKLMDMDPQERQAFLKENGLTSALDKIIVQGYKALQLEYFFTAGPDEVKAWTIQKGTKAPQAAGRIHTDFEKGFIMAEVMHFKDFKEEGTEAACKSAGKYRQQGRNYVVEDGDIIFFKFNAGAGLKDAKKK